MAIIKCKMCGGDIELTAEKTFGTCEFCGSTMTLPKIDDDQRAAAFNRGNHFRRIGEFDKALAVYERIVREDDTDAEAHWCCALCRFGIEYVEDPATYEWLPTCHRASFDSFLEDVDYLAAVAHSERITKRQYMKDGAKIAEVQRGILATSQNAEPYDVFICYKESDENGDRTRDSLMAQDIYYQLTEQGRKVFFARITLEDVAGTQYEPYIFAALNSAKVMIVVGTKPEHMNAVWVKNEWSRFLAMMRKDRHKLLLPCYRDMDPYDMPEALSVLQSYDMGKIGFIQDLTRGIAKVLDAEKKPEPVKETVVVQQTGGADTAPLLKRVFMFLEDQDWSSANEYCEKVLDMDPECAKAYLGKLMAELRVPHQELLRDCKLPFDNRNNYMKVLRFGDDELTETLQDYIAHINDRNEHDRLEGIYNRAFSAMNSAKTAQDYHNAVEIFMSIPQYRDSDELAKRCGESAEIARKDAIYEEVQQKMGIGIVLACEDALALLKSIPGWRDADALVNACEEKLVQLRAKEEEERIERRRREALAWETAERNKKRIRIATIAVAVLVAAAILLTALWTEVISPAIQYKEAVALMESGDLPGAAVAFGELGDYQDAKERSLELWSRTAHRETISAGSGHTVGLKADGTLVAAGYNSYGECLVFHWTDLVAISAGRDHTVGLKANGMVVAAGNDADGRCDVYDWRDIVAVSAGGSHTVGLKVDGTVVAAGDKEHGRCNVSEWTDIVAISAGRGHTVGLKADGTVVAVGYNGDTQCDVSGWTEIVAISAGVSHTVGLKADGTVVAVGYGGGSQCDVSGWMDIAAISAGGYHTVGLKADGTVVAVGYNGDGQCDVSGWTDIVAISAGDSYTVGLKADGTVVAVGLRSYGVGGTNYWTDIRLP